MSSAASSSVGNMPPRHGKKLADVMDEAFKTNSKIEDNRENEEKGEETPAETTDKEPLIQQPQGYTMSSVYPPQPCERCVRAKKACKGIAGARCEHCKTLHQKCSNSTGPPRGRHAGGRGSSVSANMENGAAGPSSFQARPKRKAAATTFKPDDDDEEDEDEEEEEVEKPTPVVKKRRVINNVGTRRSRLLKDVAELEGAIKKLQNTFVKDLAKLHQIAGSLAAEIRDLDDD
ncbi:hypothetical protein BDZ94DRAFT_558859 [Collybia nuda]|uniref:Zn(2)-C6 fungal-type domain-containing protein n=1 Tax=Collybia nuda TaxID=64659 RepID=A0A9P5YJZ0_9AGAR|nr:hypothetical protein BDZ94DRAFT_558859 [Collybia nuda]